MRAAVVTAPGTDPIATDFPEPPSAPGREPLTLVGAGIHHVVRGLASGQHYSSGREYPIVPGVDAVARTDAGALVYTGFARAPWGTMAERMITPFQLEVPAGADPLAVAAGMNPGLSGWMVLRRRTEEVAELGTVLVLGATGMSGSLAVQAALTLGADRVLAAGRDREALERLAALGAVPVSLDHDGPDALRDALTDVVVETPPSLVLDFVWGPVAGAAFDALSAARANDDDPEVAYVQVGSLAGARAEVPADLLRSRRIRITGSGMGSFSREELLAAAPDVLARFGDGTLDAAYTAYPLVRIADAWAHRGRSRAVVVPD